MIFNIPEEVIKLLLSILCGILVGVERETYKKPAGLRTYALVCLGSTIFSILSLSNVVSPHRIASGIVTGIGFLGAGTIWKTKNTIKGLTTAAGLWTTASIGMAIGLGYYEMAIIAVVLVLFLLILLGRVQKWIRKIQINRRKKCLKNGGRK